MTKRVKAACIAVLLFVALVPTSSTPTIEEDDPRWNCHTMGNRVCGSGKE